MIKIIGIYIGAFVPLSQGISIGEIIGSGDSFIKNGGGGRDVFNHLYVLNSLPEEAGLNYTIVTSQFLI